MCPIHIKNDVPSRKVTLTEKSAGFGPANLKISQEIKPEPVIVKKTEQLEMSKLPVSKEIKNIAKTTEEAGRAFEKATVLSTAKSSTKKIVSSGVVGVPLDMLFNSFEYHDHKTDAKTYMAKSLNGFGSWASFEAGMLATAGVASIILGKELGPFGMTSVGVGVGMITSALYSKTVGDDVETALKKVIPESVAKPVAQAMDKYFATPVDNYILKPIKNNPKISITVGAIAATALTIKYPTAFGKNVLLGFTTSSVIGAGGSYLIDKAFEDKIAKPVSIEQLPGNKNKNASVVQATAPAGKVKKAEVSLTALNTPVTKEEIAFALQLEKKYNSPEKDKITDQDVMKYNNISDRMEKMKKTK